MSDVRELILASASRRRQDLLQRLGVPFKAVPSRVEETPSEGESPREHVLRLCEEKAREVGQLYPEHWIIGADTIVLLEGAILGKPAAVLVAPALSLQRPTALPMAITLIFSGPSGIDTSWPIPSAKNGLPSTIDTVLPWPGS